MMPGDHDPKERRERFTAIFETYHSQVVAYVSRRVSSGAIDDAVADVFAAAWRDLDQLDGDPLVWLYGIGRHVVFNQWRADRRRARLADRLQQNDPVVGGDHAEHVGWEEPFEAAFATLSEVEREVLRLVAWEGLSRAEAAAVLGCSVSAFKVRLHRARRRLRGLLNAEPCTDTPATVNQSHAEHAPIALLREAR